MRKFLFILFTFLIFNQIHAQLDTKHWFAPMFDATRNPYPIQKIYLSTNRTTPFEVKIYNNNIVVGKVTISKGNPGVYSIPRSYIITTNYTDLFKPVKMGLYLEADYAYFANLRFSTVNHAEIITSKGSAGTGTLFYSVMAPISTRNDILNFMTSILATEDNTTINVSKFKPNVRFSDGISRNEFNITLNKGESYIIEGNGTYSNNFSGFIGAKIESDKPISVTNGNFNGQYAGDYPNGSDILMDQNVPVNQLGKEFVLVKGNADIGKNMEGAIIVATKDNTEIYVNNESIPLKTLNEGEYYTIIDNKYINQGKDHYNLYIQTTENAYVYQLLGGSNTTSVEATGGMNFIPALNCFLPKTIDEIGLIDENEIYLVNNSNNTYYSINNVPTKLNLITEKGAKVTVNGITPDSNYGPFDLTGGTNWVTYGIPNIKGNISIKSDKAITGGITAGSNAAGYGGFFAGLPTKPTIVADGCFPDVTLSVTPNIYESYQWFENGVPIPGANDVTFKPSKLGYYSVEVTIGTCPPLKAEFKLVNCAVESSQSFETCNTNLIVVKPKFTKSLQNIDLSSIKIITNPQKGKVSIDATSGEIIYTPNSGTSGDDEFQYKFCGTDEFADCEIVTIKVNLEDLKVVDRTIKTCNVNNSGVFDLSLAEVTDIVDATKKYYPTRLDADNETNEIIDFKNYTSQSNKKVYVVVKTKRGCEQTAEISLEFYPLPILDLSKYQTEYCGLEIQINLDQITTQILTNKDLFVVKYYTNNADALAGNTNTLPNLNTFVTETTIYARIESKNGCSPVIETLHFKFGEKVNLFTKAFSVEECDSDFDKIATVDLNAYIKNFTANGAVQISFYSSLINALQNKNSISPSQEINQSKTFYIRYELAGFCPNFSEITIDIKSPEYSTLLKDISICPNSSIILDAGNNYKSYLWNTNETSQTINAIEGNYWVDLNSLNDCSYRHHINVSLYDLPIITSIQTVDGRAIINTEGGKPPYKYSLNGITWQNSNTFTSLDNGNYTVFVVSADNCEPVKKDFSIFKINNFISPNGDGKNDKWKLKLTGYKNVIIQIFDRNAKLLKEAQVDDEFIWDGKNNGFPLASDSYWYRIALNDKESITGYLTIKNK